MAVGGGVAGIFGMFAAPEVVRILVEIVRWMSGVVAGSTGANAKEFLARFGQEAAAVPGGTGSPLLADLFALLFALLAAFIGGITMVAREYVIYFAAGFAAVVGAGAPMFWGQRWIRRLASFLGVLIFAEFPVVVGMALGSASSPPVRRRRASTASWAGPRSWRPPRWFPGRSSRRFPSRRHPHTRSPRRVAGPSPTAARGSSGCVSTCAPSPPPPPGWQSPRRLPADRSAKRLRPRSGPPVLTRGRRRSRPRGRTPARPYGQPDTRGGCGSRCRSRSPRPTGRRRPGPRTAARSGWWRSACGFRGIARTREA